MSLKAWECVRCGDLYASPKIELATVECRCGVGAGGWVVATFDVADVAKLRAQLRECERERDEALEGERQAEAQSDLHHRLLMEACDERDAARAEVARLIDGIKAIRAAALAECNKTIRPTLDDVIGAVIDRCDDLLPVGGA